MEGPSIATAQLQVVTQKGDTLVIPVYPKRKGNSETVSIYRQGFQYVALPTQPFHGVVTDKETGAPLADMVVLPEGKRWMGKAVTDKEGRYRMLGLPSGFHTIRVEASRDQPYHHRVDGGGQKTGIEPVRLDFALTKAPWVTGRITDVRTKEPIEGAKLEYNPNRDNKSAWDYLGLDFDVNSRAETDADGRFRIRALPGSGWLFVDHERSYLRASSRDLQGDIENRVTPDKIDISGKEYLSEWTNAIVAVTAEKDKGKDYSITLDAGSTVPVTVSDPAGKPVSGVIARGLAYPWFFWSKSFPAGQFKATTIDLARPRAVVFYQPERELGLLFKPAAGDAGPWAIRLQPTATVTGRVLLDGKPIANVQISSSFSQPGQMGWSEPPKRESAIKTDSAGRFRIPNVIADLDYVIGYSITQGTTYRSGSHSLRLKPGEKKDLGDVEVPAEKK